MVISNRFSCKDLVKIMQIDSEPLQSGWVSSSRPVWNVVKKSIRNVQVDYKFSRSFYTSPKTDELIPKMMGLGKGNSL